MIFIPENRDDILKYYRHTYIKLKEAGDTLFFIERVDEDAVYGKAEDGRPFILHLDKEHPYEVDFVLPHKSFFQYFEHAALLERVPARMYYRGVHENNTRCTVYKSTGPSMTLVNFDTLKAFVNKQPWKTIDEVLTNKDLVSGVLSPRMALFRTARTLWIDHLAVATVHTKDRIIRVQKTIFMPEIQQLVCLQPRKWKVVVDTQTKVKEKELENV